MNILKGYFIKVCLTSVSRPFCFRFVFYFFFFSSYSSSLPPTALHDFSAIYHPIFLKVGQMIDNEWLKSCIVFGVQKSKVKVTRTQNRKTGSCDFSVIFHPIVMKLGWCIDISKCSIHLHLQGHRSKVKVTRRQSLKIGPTCVTRFLWRFLSDPFQI